MASRCRRIAGAVAVLGLCAMFTVVDLPAAGTPVRALPPPATKVTGTLSGRTNGRILAILPSGSTAWATVSAAGKFTLTLPKSSSTTLKVTLQVVNADGSYAGPISIGKKPKATSKFYSWYGAVSVPKGVTTALPTMTWSSSSKFGYMKLALTSRLTVGNVLRGVNGLTGKPAGAGRLGLSASRARTASGGVAGIWASGAHAAVDQLTEAGDDLDGDGIPNSLDIDDDGDGFPDPVDPSTSGSGTNRSSVFDVVGFLQSGIDESLLDDPAAWSAPLNYNILSQQSSNVSDLVTKLAKMDSEHYGFSIQVAWMMFSNDFTKKITDAWVDCTGLGWCTSTDAGSGDALAPAPRITSTWDDSMLDLWSYGFTPTPGTPCNSRGNQDGTGPACTDALWGSFSSKSFLATAKANGSTQIPQDTIDWVGSHTGGFGLFDNEILSSNKGSGAGATIIPGGGPEFLNNFMAGDVFYVNAKLSDGSTTSVAMTIAPFFITAPTVFAFRSPGDTADSTIDYTQPSNGCQNPGDACRWGTYKRAFEIPASDPVLTFKFWRPQRQRIVETDGAGGLPFLDMGNLEYRVSAHIIGRSWGGEPFYDCKSDAMTATSDNGTALVSGSEAVFVRDQLPDDQPSAGRYITMTIHLDKCSATVNGKTVHLSPSASDPYNVYFGAYAQPKMNGNRSSATQYFRIAFK